MKNNAIPQKKTPTKEWDPAKYKVGQRIQKLRKEHGLNNAVELARLIKKNESTVKLMEAGYNYPTIDTLRILHRKFKVSYEYLIDGRKK